MELSISEGRIFLRIILMQINQALILCFSTYSMNKAKKINIINATKKALAVMSFFLGKTGSREGVGAFINLE